MSYQTRNYVFFITGWAVSQVAYGRVILSDLFACVHMGDENWATVKTQVALCRGERT